MASWIDTFISTPIIGIQIRPNFKVMCNYPQLMASFFEDILEEETEVTISENSISNGFRVTSKDGFSYILKSDNILVSFMYPSKENKSPGNFLQLEWPEVKPYTKILADTSSKIKEILKILVKENNISALKIGIVANIQLNRSEAPPGVSLLIEHLGKPWNGSLIKCQATLTNELDETNKIKERCHHLISFDETINPGEINISLDWQRIYDEWINLKDDLIVNQIDECYKKSIEYFEKFGIGDLNYE
jgi:hypothetical protein